MNSRADLVEYLCNQQHAAFLLAQCQAGQNVSGAPWSNLPDTLRDADRAGVRAVLEELEDLGLLVSARVPT